MKPLPLVLVLLGLLWPTVPQAKAPTCVLSPIFFGEKESTPPRIARTTIKANAKCIRRRGEPVTIEAHTDSSEFGAEEYAMAAADRRAQAVKQALVSHGVPAKLLSTMSYGAERPRCTDGSAVCRARNRRVELRDKKETPWKRRKTR